MSEKNHSSIILELAGAFEAGDLDKMLSLFTTDIKYVNPFGNFEGISEAERFLRWNLNNVKTERISEEGIGIVVQGDKAFYDHRVECTINGAKADFLAMSSFEFSNGKINLWRQIFDRLSVAEQTASGFLPKKTIGAIVREARKGLE